MTHLTSTTSTERTALSERAVATLRTAVPALWGLLVSALLGALAGRLPSGVYEVVERVLGSETLVLLVVTVVITAWYWLWRRLEDHVPLWLVRLALGSARTPSYAPVTADGAVVITSAGRGPCDQCGAPSTRTTTPGGFRFCDAHGPGTRSASLTPDERANLSSLRDALDEGDPGRTALERVLTR
ncbi:MAG: hypothetical protein NVV66_18245 [Cellulomonas sp.]|uniref:hypothetical protein n=1 Tax=Cellulomonas sp. TaxID=40001 RepID=UPI00258DBC61|nr:hypothetical protein [Cellulomonas sp.]MCR6706538.1 hypothetical protein [Cellulomonas sp.]